MNKSPLTTCPGCGELLEHGFTARGIGLSFIRPGKFEKFMFLDEDVSKAGLRKFLPWKAEYYRSSLCRSCKLHLVDYSQTYTRREAGEAAKLLP